MKSIDVITAFLSASLGSAAVTAVCNRLIPSTGQLHKRANSTSKKLTEPASTTAPSPTGCLSTVPAYASACPGTVRYSSACACAGVTSSRVQPSTVSTTVTTTLTPATTTVTTTPSPTTVTSTVTVAFTGSTTLLVPVITGTDTTTVTVATDPITVPVTPTAPPSCGNAGLQWAYYPDIQPATNPTQDSAFDPTVFKSKTPSIAGNTTYLSISNNGGEGTQPIYGSSPQSGQDYVVNHRSYLFAPETGTYSFTANSIDDILEAWIGPVAYSGWTAQNDFEYSAFNGGAADTTATMPLTGGLYYAIRLVYKQGPGAASFRFTITSPSGLALVGNDPSVAISPYIVQYSCDGTSVPQYPAFGQET